MVGIRATGVVDGTTSKKVEARTGLNKPQSEPFHGRHVDSHQHGDEAAEARVEAGCVIPPLAGPVQLNHAIRS